jgi:hypothetical protein
VLTGVEHELALLAFLIAVVVIAYVLRKVGVLPFSPTEKAAADRADRAERELAEANKRIGELEATRSMKPLLELQRETAALVTTAIEKLASFNGSMKAIHAGLDETNAGLMQTNETLTVTVEALKMVAGLVVGATEIEPGPRRGSMDT